MAANAQGHSFNLACLRTKKNEDVISSSLQVYILQRVDRGFIIVDQTGYCKLRISDDESKSNVPQIGLYYRLKSFKWHNWEIHLTKKSLKPFKCKKFVIDEGLLNRARASENEPSCPLTTVSQLLALTVDASADVEEKHDAIALTGVVKRVDPSQKVKRNGEFVFNRLLVLEDGDHEVKVTQWVDLRFQPKVGQKLLLDHTTWGWTNFYRSFTCSANHAHDIQVIGDNTIPIKIIGINDIAVGGKLEILAEAGGGPYEEVSEIILYVKTGVFTEKFNPQNHDFDHIVGLMPISTTVIIDKETNEILNFTTNADIPLEGLDMGEPE